MKTIVLYISLLLALPAFTQEQVANPELGNIFEPEPVTFSFSTPGWYVVGIVLLVVVIIFVARWAIRYKKNAYRREALKQIESDSINIIDVFILLKIVATKTFGRKQVAQLHGKEWLIFLESKAKNTAFTNYENDIINTLYKGSNSDNEKAIVELSKKWIKTHA